VVIWKAVLTRNYLKRPITFHHIVDQQRPELILRAQPLITGVLSGFLDCTYTTVHK